MATERIVAPKVKKPRVLGLVFVLLLRSVLIYIAYNTIQEINRAPALYQGWVLPFYYVLFAMGIAMFIGAILIAIYKRLGLFIGAGTSILDFIFHVAAVSSADANFEPNHWFARNTNNQTLHPTALSSVFNPQRVHF